VLLIDAELSWPGRAMSTLVSVSHDDHAHRLTAAVCFWTVFTSLGFQLFYWSVWKLALAGSELALLANLSAFTLSSKGTRGYVGSKGGLFTNRLIMIAAGMGVYFIPSPVIRLAGIIVGTWTGWLAVFGNTIRTKGSRETLVEGESWCFGC